jgi:hypothetical protein
MSGSFCASRKRKVPVVVSRRKTAMESSSKAET